MIFIIHFGLYALFVGGVLLFMVVRWALAGQFTDGCRAAACGLLASFLGLVLPFALAPLASRVFYGHALPVGGGEDIGSTLLALFLLSGPLVGPPVVFALVVWLYHLR